MNKDCLECKGTGVYQGLFTSEPCKACSDPICQIESLFPDIKLFEGQKKIIREVMESPSLQALDNAEKNLVKFEGYVPRCDKLKQKFKEMDARDFWKGAYPGMGLDIPPYEDPGDAKADCDKVGKTSPRLGDFVLKYGSVELRKHSEALTKEMAQAKAVEACKSFAATVARLMQQHSKLGMGNVVLVDELAEAIGVTRQDAKDLQYAYSYGAAPIDFCSKLELAKAKYVEMCGNLVPLPIGWEDKSGMFYSKPVEVQKAIVESIKGLKIAAIAEHQNLFNIVVNRLIDLVRS